MLLDEVPSVAKESDALEPAACSVQHKQFRSSMQ